MKLSELYKMYIEEANVLLQKADTAPEWIERDVLRSQAAYAQSTAGYIAHLALTFGDQAIETMPIQNMMKVAERMKCVLENPWARGLRVIQRKIDSVSSSGEASFLRQLRIRQHS